MPSSTAVAELPVRASNAPRLRVGLRITATPEDSNLKPGRALWSHGAPGGARCGRKEANPHDSLNAEADVLNMN
jgi:hypothetical protein